MDDIPAVRWSDYEQHRTIIASETRTRISHELSTLMEDAVESGRSGEYVAGIEAAMLTVLRSYWPPIP